LLLGIAVPACAQHEQQGDKQDHQEKQQGKHEQARPGQQHAQQQHDQKQQEPQHAQQTQAQPQSQNTQQGGAGQQKSGGAHQRTEQAKQTQQQDQNGQQHGVQQKPSGKTQQQPQHAQYEQRHDQNNQENARQQHGNQQPQRTQQQQHFQQAAWQQHRSERWESDHRTWQQRGGYSGYRIPDARFRGYFGQDHGFRIYGRPFLVVGGYPRFQYSGYWFSMVDPWPDSWADNWYDTDDVYVTYVDRGYYLFDRRHPDVGIAISISL
jgi:hypothetical protein